jgi:hypothetical protein
VNIRKWYSILFSIVMLTSLNGCFMSMENLFTIPLKEGTYQYMGDEEIIYHGRQISEFRLHFKEVKNFENSNDYFIDYATDPDTYYLVTLFMVIDDGDLKQYDVVFMGKAHSRMRNAYWIEIYCEEYEDDLSIMNMMIKLHANDSKSLDYLTIEIKDSKSIETIEFELEMK